MTIAKPYAESFYQSRAWKNTREAYKSHVNYLCERCRADEKLKAGDIVHHIEHITPENINDPDITLSFDNLQLLCIECHNIIHYRKYDETRPDLMFTADGDIVQVNQDTEGR